MNLPRISPNNPSFSFILSSVFSSTTDGCVTFSFPCAYGRPRASLRSKTAFFLSRPTPLRGWSTYRENHTKPLLNQSQRRGITFLSFRRRTKHIHPITCHQSTFHEGRIKVCLGTGLNRHYIYTSRREEGCLNRRQSYSSEMCKSVLNRTDFRTLVVRDFCSTNCSMLCISRI